MTFQVPTLFTFFMLALAIFSVWLKPLQFNERIALPPWIACFAVSMVGGLIAGVLRPIAVVELGLFCAIVYLSRESKQKSGQKTFFSVLTGILALAFALHRLPGFINPLVIESMTLSTGAATFTQYANFDKGAVGLIFLAFMCSRVNTFSEWWKLIRQVAPITLITAAVVLGVAIGLGYIKPDFKISETTAWFLLINFFFTVIAEEVFFRGFLQERLAVSLSRFRYGQLITVICSALLFGVAHAAGGVTYTLLASLAGLGYAYAYHVSKRIEAPIIVHFVLNAVHFIGFTYPHIA